MKHLPASRLDFESLRGRLKAKNQAVNLSLRQKFPHIGKFLASGFLAGNLLLPPASQVHSLKLPTEVVTTINLSQVLTGVDNFQITHDQENKISQVIAETYGVKATAELEGNRLNNSYGRMGAEQHLARFPGDHVENIAPGLGGWGYVSDFEVEKWYVAVQTLYLPTWDTDTKNLSRWYKFRRVIVVNPANGKAVVSAVADAGPANWTGKHFGGSPEVMEYLGVNYGKQNHPVVLFFLDDPNKEIPLGPLDYNWEKYKLTLKDKA